MKKIKLILLFTAILLSCNTFAQPFFKGKDSILIVQFMDIYEDAKNDFKGHIGKKLYKTKYDVQISEYAYTMGCTETMTIQNERQLFYNFSIKFVGKEQEKKAEVLKRFLEMLEKELKIQDYVFEQQGDVMYIIDPKEVTILAYTLIDNKLIEFQIRSSGDDQFARNKKHREEMEK